MSLRWADPMPQGRRVADSVTALRKGRALVHDALMSCPRTLHITLFFDGTNNNDLPTNPFRGSLVHTRSNVARGRTTAWFGRARATAHGALRRRHRTARK